MLCFSNRLTALLDATPRREHNYAAQTDAALRRRVTEAATSKPLRPFLKLDSQNSPPEWNPACFHSPAPNSDASLFDLTSKIAQQGLFFFSQRVVWGQSRVKRRTRHSQEPSLCWLQEPGVAFLKTSTVYQVKALHFLAFSFQVDRLFVLRVRREGFNQHSDRPQNASLHTGGAACFGPASGGGSGCDCGPGDSSIPLEVAAGAEA